MERSQWNQLWFVLTAFFLFLFILISTEYSTLSAGTSLIRVTFFITNFANVIVTRQDHSTLPSDDQNRSTADSRISKVISDREPNSTLITNCSTTNTSSTLAYPFSQAIQPQNSSTPGENNDSKTTTLIDDTPQPIPKHVNKSSHQNPDSDSCLGQYIYVYDLPKRFNQDLLKNCHSLQKWIDMCPYMSNMGLGPELVDKYSETNGQAHDELSRNGWFATNQFSLEVIFHNRMKQYKCLTNDSSLASAFFVPFYAGLDVGQYHWGYNISVKDAAPSELVKWLSDRAEWRTMWGKDHFLIGGRIAWDFRRQSDDDSDWGTKLMFLPESKNMTLLSIESSSWKNEQAIPYPTYFHPSKKSQVLEWQARMRNQERNYLFSFAGSPRPDYKPNIRNMLISQCKSSTKYCKLVQCHHGANKCEDPLYVMKVFESSVFCLQPTGDSFTRRSIFDSILAGCIPVFFHPGSAYVQYTWHFPRDISKYSVFISENDIKKQKLMINDTLLGFPKHQVKAMREEVIRLIPRIIYADPRASRLEKIEDAFDIAVKRLLQKIEKTRRDMKEGKDPGSAFSEINATKFDIDELGESY